MRKGPVYIRDHNELLSWAKVLMNVSQILKTHISQSEGSKALAYHRRAPFPVP